MGKHHSPRFLQLVQQAKKHIRETNVDEVKARLDRGEKLCIVDVREESEWAKDHLPGAVYLGKGVIERDVEQRLPDAGAEIILYCGGGFRSALAAENFRRWVTPMSCRWTAASADWREKGYPLTRAIASPLVRECTKRPRL